MKYYSKNFSKAFNALDVATQITGYRFQREKCHINTISVKMHKNEPLSDAEADKICDFIQYLLIWDKFFRSDRKRVDNVLWLLDAMDDYCKDFSNYEADIVNE